VKEAAECAGLSEATLHRYLNDPAFMKEYNEVRNQTVKSMVNRLSSASHTAISKLLSIIKNSKHEGNVIRACEIILNASLKGNEVNRLMEIEEKLDEAAERGKVRAV
jgi:hypothetical protein